METKVMLLLLLYFSYAPTFADKVFWVPNRSIYLASNFEDGKLPCPGQNIVFPEAIEESVVITGLTVSGLILPLDGEIILNDGELVFGSEDNNCTRTGDTFYKDGQALSWAQPDVWSSSRFNEATPDAERIPCVNDTVYFPNKAQFALILPSRPQIIEAIKEKGTERDLSIYNLLKSQTNDQFEQFIGQINMLLVATDFKRSYERPCHSSLHGCSCQDVSLDIDCKLKYCPPPRCVHPIKPIGHCCEICGASLLIEIAKDFNMVSFQESVRRIIDGYGAYKFVYHIGLLPQYESNPYDKQPDRVQVIVMDKGEYTGVCQQVISDINYGLSGDWVIRNEMLFSGKTISQSGEGGKIFISVFFLVAIAMVVLFGYYYKWSTSHLRELRGGIGRGMLSRLRRRTESVLTLARRDSTVSTATTSGIAFRNPMYSSIRERVQVAAAVDEE